MSAATVPDPSGHGCLKQLQCQYHGWTYALDGQLVRAPEMESVEDFDVEDVRLPRFRLEEWANLLFNKFDDEALGPSSFTESRTKSNGSRRKGSPPSSSAISRSATKCSARMRRFAVAVQRGLSSPFYDRGRYSVRRENGVYHFHQLYAKAMAD